MKITELTGYKNSTEYTSLIKHPSFENFANLAKEKGWIIYGTGGNGVVLRHPNKNWVYKVFTDAPGDMRYYDYISWVANHQSNPFVPRASRPIKIPNTAQRGEYNQNLNLYFVRLEILSPAKGPNDPRFEKYIHPAYDRSLSVSTGYASDTDDVTLYDHALQSLWEHNKDYREVWDFAQHTLDMGLDNVMFRNDQLVITDPMA